MSNAQTHTLTNGHTPPTEGSNSTGSDGSGLFLIEDTGTEEDEAAIVSSEG